MSGNLGTLSFLYRRLIFLRNRPCSVLLYSCSQPELALKLAETLSQTWSCYPEPAAWGVKSPWVATSTSLCLGVLLLFHAWDSHKGSEMDRFPCYSRKVQIPDTGYIYVFLETSRIQGCKCVTGVAKAFVSAVGWLLAWEHLLCNKYETKDGLKCQWRALSAPTECWYLWAAAVSASWSDVRCYFHVDLGMVPWSWVSSPNFISDKTLLVTGRKSNPEFWSWEVQSHKRCLSWVGHDPAQKATASWLL